MDRRRTVWILIALLMGFLFGRIFTNKPIKKVYSPKGYTESTEGLKGLKVR